jgi:hypothetical protein
MMAMTDPRLRALLRQAERTAASGKRAAAQQLYQQILAEAPESIDALLGLAAVTADDERQRTLYEQVLQLEPDNAAAAAGLRGDGTLPQPAPAPVREAPPARPAPASPERRRPPIPARAAAPAAAEELLYCYRHPDRQTGLRCYNCHRPICTQCAKRTPVGYLCPQCVREAQDVFFTAGPIDYLLAGLAALVLGVLAGFLVPRLGFFVIFLAPAAGTLIGRLAFRAARRRHGRWLPHLVGAMVIFGGLLPALPWLLNLQLGGLLWPGLYVFLATGAAYYQVR